MKRVLSVQDLSCLGKCSLTVTLPVISAMGCECSVLPTAVLSTHTAFPQPHVRSLTEDIGDICAHWQAIGAGFDAISIGYLSDPSQAAAVENLIDTFGCPVILDPVMGDNGKLYSRITDAHKDAMRSLARKAKLLLPNVTEAAALAGMPYREDTDKDYYLHLGRALLELGTEAVVITGVCLSEGKIGFLCLDRDGESFYQTKKHPRAFHGTGDLFSAVVTGALTLGMELQEAAVLAAGFVEKCIASTRECTPYGVEFETQLPWLWQKLQSSQSCTCGCPGF